MLFICLFLHVCLDSVYQYTYMLCIVNNFAKHLIYNIITLNSEDKM